MLASGIEVYSYTLLMLLGAKQVPSQVCNKMNGMSGFQYTV